MVNSRFWWKFWQVRVQIVDSTSSICFSKADPFLQRSIKIFWLKCFDRFLFDFSTKYYILYFAFHVVMLWRYANTPCQYQNETIRRHSNGILRLILILILQSYCSAGTSKISAWVEMKTNEFTDPPSEKMIFFFWKEEENRLGRGVHCVLLWLLQPCFKRWPDLLI